MINEPIACVEYIPCCTDQTCSKCKAANPPQRTWVGLTDEEVGDLSDFAYANDEEFVRNVEKYLKEKNNG